MTTLSAGNYVTANVRLVKKLGEGGMGSVWVAEHLTLRTYVAVKFMSTALAMDPGASARFSREAASAAQIKSPHVVQTYDHGITSNGIPFIVMELLEGEDLGVRIKRAGPISLADTSIILTQACKALGRAHSIGIVHRDIKPDNIFLVSTEDELYVKILDFGIAKSVDGQGGFQMTSTGAMMGTPYYMSPEQLVNSKGVDFRADLWSLAVVVYHCVTGNVPFDGETFAGLCIAIDKGTFAPATTLGGQLPQAIDGWFERALRRNPAERFASAKEMAETFHAVATPGGAYRPGMLSIPDAAPVEVHSVTGGGPVHPLTLTGAAISSANIPKKSNAGLIIGGAVLSLVLLAGAGALLFNKLASSELDPAAAPEAVSSAPLAATTEPAPVDSAVLDVLADAAPDAPAASVSSEPPHAPPPVVASPPPTRTPHEAPPKSTNAGPPKPATTEVDRGF